MSSSGEIALSVENISKRFLIPRAKGPDTNDQFEKKFGTKQEIWPLKNVNFSLLKGEKVGLIGRNGAGKSTLLKILSRIMYPTHGQITINGHVGSLLEVGTGFHPEMTGRQNIYLNGTILGMSKGDIQKKFDEIVDFSGVEKFLESPIKHYSSGMVMRLAFAVSAFLDTDIMLIDEVLAVGDFSFQKKCLDKIREFSSNERTVVFVSHNMDAIRKLCPRAIYLLNGSVVRDGNTNDVLNEYVSSMDSKVFLPLKDRVDRLGSGKIRFTNIFIETSLGKGVQQIYSGQDVKIHIHFDAQSDIDLSKLTFSLGMVDENDTYISDFNFENYGFQISNKFTRHIVCHISRIPLNSGKFYFNLMARRKGVSDLYEDYIQNAITFEILPGNFFNETVPPYVRLLIGHRFEEV